MQRWFAGVAVLLLLAGCAQQAQLTPPKPTGSSNAGHLSSADLANGAIKAKPPPKPIYINGTFNSLASCGQVVVNAFGNAFEVPKAAWGRKYEGPKVTGGTYNGPGELCIDWLDGSGPIQPDKDKVPNGATQVLVKGTAQYNATFTIKIL
jgi:hypothetical protein